MYNICNMYLSTTTLSVITIHVETLVWNTSCYADTQTITELSQWYRAAS
jgi:hypothetical protein